MKIIVGTRRTGKTTRLIQESLKSGATIICPTYKMAHILKHRARTMGLKIPEPLSFDHYEKLEDKPEHVLVDELQSFSRLPSGIDGFTLDISNPNQIEYLEENPKMEDMVDLMVLKKFSFYQTG